MYPYRLYIILSVLLFTSCGILSDAEEHTIVSIEKEVELSIKQVLQEGENDLIFEITTIQERNCPDAHITARSHSVSQQLAIDVGTPKITNCNRVPGKLLSAVEVDVEVGEYNFSFNLDSAIENKGLLTVDEYEYKLELETFDGIVFRNRIMTTIPDHIIWGRISTDSKENLIAMQKMYQDIVSKFDAHSLEDGYYGHFSIQDGALEINRDDLEWEYLDFALSYNLNNISLKKYVESIKREYPKVQIDIISGIGEI